MILLFGILLDAKLGTAILGMLSEVLECVDGKYDKKDYVMMISMLYEGASCVMRALEHASGMHHMKYG